MVIIRFPDTDGKRQALGYLLGRFPGKTWVTGEMMVPEVALAHLAAEGIAFFVEGSATYDRIMKLDAAAAELTQKSAAAV